MVVIDGPHAGWSWPTWAPAVASQDDQVRRALRNFREALGASYWIGGPGRRGM